MTTLDFQFSFVSASDMMASQRSASGLHKSVLGQIGSQPLNVIWPTNVHNCRYVRSMYGWWFHDMEALSGISGPLWGRAPATSAFPSQKANNVEFRNFAGPNNLLQSSRPCSVTVIYRGRIHRLHRDLRCLRIFPRSSNFVIFWHTWQFHSLFFPYKIDYWFRLSITYDELIETKKQNSWWRSNEWK